MLSLSAITIISLALILFSILGTGAFSEVHKVFRKSDRKEYALKKVSLQTDIHQLID